jgi:hypothetical protein
MNDVPGKICHPVQYGDGSLLPSAIQKSSSGQSRAHSAATAAASKRKKSPRSSDSDSAASGSGEKGEADRLKPKKKGLRKSGSGLTSKKAKALFDDEAQVSSSESGDVSSYHLYLR